MDFVSQTGGNINNSHSLILKPPHPRTGTTEFYLGRAQLLKPFLQLQTAFVLKHTVSRNSPGGLQIQWAGFSFVASKQYCQVTHTTGLQDNRPGTIERPESLGRRSKDSRGNRTEVNLPHQMPD